MEEIKLSAKYKKFKDINVIDPLDEFNDEVESIIQGIITSLDSKVDKLQKLESLIKTMD